MQRVADSHLPVISHCAQKETLTGDKDNNAAELQGTSCEGNHPSLPLQNRECLGDNAQAEADLCQGQVLQEVVLWHVQDRVNGGDHNERVSYQDGQEHDGNL